MQLTWKSEICSRPSDKSCRYSTCPTVSFTRLRRLNEWNFKWCITDSGNDVLSITGIKPLPGPMTICGRCYPWKHFTRMKIWKKITCLWFNYFLHLVHSPFFKSMAQIAKFMGPTWGPPGSCRPQMGPMLAPWTLLSEGFATTNPKHVKE